MPHNLQQCFEKALEYEVSFQLSEGVNMAQKTSVMNVNVEEEDAVNFIKDARARSNTCFKCGEMGHFQCNCQYNGDKPSDNQAQGQTALDSYDPVVGKWMTNLVATTPITAKAMQSLLLELNQQKELKRTYRRQYKDLQTATTTTNTLVTAQPLMSTANTKTSTNPSPLKSSLGQGKKIVGKGKNSKPTDKGKKRVVISTSSPVVTTSTVSLPNLRNKLQDKAKVTVAMIQELTEDLQSMEQESLTEEQESEVTQESDLEQEDSEEYLTETEDQWLTTKQNSSLPCFDQQITDKTIDNDAISKSQENINDLINHTEEVVIRSEQGTTFPTKVGATLCNALIDTSATRSCMSEAYYRTLQLNSICSLSNTCVRSATESNLSPLGIVNCTFELGEPAFTSDFIVCKNLTRPLILARDFLMRNHLAVRYLEDSKCILNCHQEELIATLHITSNPQLRTMTTVFLPGRTLAVIQVNRNLVPEQRG